MKPSITPSVTPSLSHGRRFCWERGAEIPVARLHAVPNAVRCVRCQAPHDEPRAVSTTAIAVSWVPHGWGVS